MGTEYAPIQAARSLARFRGVDVSHLVVRETFGADERQAKGLAEAKGSGNVTDALVQLSIVSFDEKPVERQPFAAYDDWNSRTRSFAFALWRSINGITAAERVRLLNECAKPSIGRAMLFDVSGFERLNVKSFVLRETTGIDERAAKARAERDATTTGLAESVRLSIAAVDGKPLDVEDERAFYDAWNSRTRGLLLAAWTSINSVVDEELSDFLAEAAAPTVPMVKAP